jgi:LysM repeat protein
MRDYKNIFQDKYKKLEYEINKSFRAIHNFEYKRNKFRYISIIKKFICKPLLIASVSAVIFIPVLILIVINLTSKKPGYSFEGSYFGIVKIQEELDSMVNIYAEGGNEIKINDTNNNELKFFFYKIKQGESLFTISKKLGISMDTLISLNSIENAHSIDTGKRIIIPNLQGIIYCVKKGDTLESIAEKYKISTDDIKDANDIEAEPMTEGVLTEGTVLFLPGATLTEAERAKALGYWFIKPLHGLFTSIFGIRRDPFTGEMGFHPGIDISAPYGSIVRAAKEGLVVFAGWNGGYGKCIMLKHQFGYETLYGHLSQINVGLNAWVKEGQVIARVGTTGRSTGPHLHFEVRKFGRPTNPVRVSGLGKGPGQWY